MQDARKLLWLTTAATIIAVSSYFSSVNTQNNNSGDSLLNLNAVVVTPETLRDHSSVIYRSDSHILQPN